MMFLVRLHLQIAEQEEVAFSDCRRILMQASPVAGLHSVPQAHMLHSLVVVGSSPMHLSKVSLVR